MEKKSNAMDLRQQWLQSQQWLQRQQNRIAIDPQRQQQQQLLQPQQQQRVPQDVASSSASMDSTAQTGQHLGDYREEIYQKIKDLKYIYFDDLNAIYQKLEKLSQVHRTVPPNASGREGEWIEGIEKNKLELKHIMEVLQLNKHNIPIGLKSKLPLYEKQMVDILQKYEKVAQKQFRRRAPDEQHLPPPPQSQPGLQSQQMDNNLNQLRQQLSNSRTPQSNKLRMPIVMQQGMQNNLQPDRLQASATGFGSLEGSSMGPTMKGTMNPPQMVCSGQMGQSQAGSLAVGTPGQSAAPLLAEFTSPEAGEGTNLSTQVPETEKPIEKLAYLMRTMPQDRLSAAVKDIASVVALVDRIAGSAPGNGSRAAIGDDLLAMAKCQLQAKDLVHPDVGVGTPAGASPPTKMIKRDIRALPLDSNNNYGFSPDSDSVTDNLKASSHDTSKMPSAATSFSKGLKSKLHHALLEEIREINIRLIDTELTLKEEDADSIAESGESIFVKCTYNAITLSPGLRAHFISKHLAIMQWCVLSPSKRVEDIIFQVFNCRNLVKSGVDWGRPGLRSSLKSHSFWLMLQSSANWIAVAAWNFDNTSPILPLTLLVPPGYPKCSPVILNKLLDEQRDPDNFYTRARSKFDISIQGLSQPMSLKEIAVTWDTCARKVIQEYAAQVAGRSFSSRMIKWQTINPDDPYVIV